MSAPNPPLPPASHSDVKNPYAPCPRCGSRGATRMTFTWWGGLVGPAILTHVQCDRCRRTFNGKSGQPNDTAIAIYLGVCLAAAVAVAIASLSIASSAS